MPPPGEVPDAPPSNLCIVRRFVLLLGLVIAAVAIGGAPVARSEPSPALVVTTTGDWLSVVVTADTDVTDLKLVVDSSVFYQSVPTAVGLGLRGSDIFGAWIEAFPVTREPTVRVVGVPGGEMRFVAPQRGGRGFYSQLHVLNLQTMKAGEEVELLDILPGGAGDHAAILRTGSGTAHLNVRSGVGSQEVNIATSRTTGVGIGTPVVTAGDMSVQRGPKSSIVGGLARCSACVIDITHEGTTVSSGGLYRRPLFAGSAGDWLFRWTGADVSTTSGLLAVYAPVGDDVIRPWASAPELR